MKFEIWCGPTSSSVNSVDEEIDKSRQMSRDAGERLIQMFEAPDMEEAEERLRRFDRMFGETMIYAQQVLKLNVRETVRDGEPLVRTMDFNETRYNVKTEKGLIVDVVNMG
jgi:hypothetical protein